MKRKSKQILLMVLTVVLATFAGGSLYLYMWLKNSVPNTSGEIVIEGIENSIEITYDQMGIPQIWAKTERDGYLALGYLHASDRMFQMDMARRMSHGRMSELLGNVTLETDKTQRQIGHNRMAKRALSNLDESNKLRLQAYADGVNAYKKVSGAPPFEYLLLGATFEDWSVYDCLTLLSFQTWYSDALQNHDKYYLEL
ncbi:MAG: penicillin acylase family protein, partial [Candidatus Zixiibacteriota bacterium]